MEIKYPVITEIADMTETTRSIRVVDDFSMLRFIANYMSDTECEFLRQLVADANNAATVQADYDRLGTKIDEMVEARTFSLAQRIRVLEGEAFVDQQTIKGLREAYDVEAKAHAELRRKVDLTHTYTIDQLMKDKESLLAKVANYKETVRQLMDNAAVPGQENARLRFAVRAMKQTIGEQRAHLRRLRAKMVVRARRMGELKQIADKFRNEGSVMGWDVSGDAGDAMAYTFAAASEPAKASRDAEAYGMGFMLNGKHVPAKDVMVDKGHFFWGPPAHRLGRGFKVADQIVADKIDPSWRFRRGPNGTPSVFGEIDRVVDVYNDGKFYQDLKNLIVKNFVPRYPFPKKGK
jgi:hypothetical protein